MLINKKAVKVLALDARKRLRPSWNSNRVSGEFLENAEAALKRWVEDRVRSHPSVGKTIT